MSEKKERILVVDDERDLCEILKYNLETDGYDVDTAYSAEEALAKGVSGFNLLLLDVMMGGMSGFAMARQLRSDPATAQIPIIFLTARDAENDVVTGFNLGADDYISKPFSIREVLLRVRAVLNRTAAPAAADAAPETLAFHGLKMDIDQKSVSVDGREVPFTKTEFKLLQLLLQRRGHVLSRQEIITYAWPDDVLVSGRTVDVNITRLRRKIGPYASCIVTKPGFGYCFQP